MLIQIALYIIPSLLFILFGYMVITDYQKLDAFKKRHHMEGFLNGLHHIKLIVEESEDMYLKKDYEKLRRHRRRKFFIWVVALLAAIVLLTVIGIISTAI